jgi:hypothetical protein
MSAGGVWGAVAASVGGLIQNRRAQNQSKKQWESEFYRGIQTRVADAKAAGIHPLYAIGANTYSSSPQMVGDSGAGANLANVLMRNEALKETRRRNDAEIGLLREQTRAAKLRNDDFVLKSKNSSDIEVGTQPGFATPDKFIEAEPDRVPASATKSQASGPGGTYFPDDKLLFNSKQASKQQLEDRTGEIYSEIKGSINTLKASGQYHAIKRDIAKSEPITPFDIWARNKTGNKLKLLKKYENYKSQVKFRRAYLLKLAINRFLQRRD